MTDAEDGTLHMQLAHLAEQGRRATGGKLAAFIVEFWDEKKGMDAYACVAAHKDGESPQAMSEVLYAICMTVQTMLHSIDQQMLIKDLETGEVNEFNVHDPHSLLFDVDDPEEDC